MCTILEKNRFASVMFTTFLCIHSLNIPVKAVPEICSAYRPKGHFCGLFCPLGTEPGQRGSSEINSLPKPDKYWNKSNKERCETI
jgi:hypothetical protein